MLKPFKRAFRILMYHVSTEIYRHWEIKVIKKGGNIIVRGVWLNEQCFSLVKSDRSRKYVIVDMKTYLQAALLFSRCPREDEIRERIPHSWALERHLIGQLQWRNEILNMPSIAWKRELKIALRMHGDPFSYLILSWDVDKNCGCRFGWQFHCWTREQSLLAKKHNEM